MAMATQQYSAPQLKNVPTSPSPTEIRKREASKIKPTWQQMISNKHIINSLRWGFSIGTIYTFLSLYHTRGNIPRSLVHGSLGALCVIPYKYYFYMKKQKIQFFRAIEYSHATGDTNVIAKDPKSEKIQSREAMYDPSQPYSDEEWAYAQRVYKRTIITGLTGALTGGIIGYSILHFGKWNRGKNRPAAWIRIGFMISCIGFGSVLFMRIHMQKALEELQTWKPDGRLKQEIKYVLSWINSDEKSKEQAEKQMKKTSLVK